MSTFRTNTIVVRGESYTVQEMSGLVMAGARKLISDEKEKFRMEAWVAWKCCLTPKFESEDAAAKEPQAIVDAISSEAFRLSKADDAPKEGAAEKA